MRKIEYLSHGRSLAVIPPPRALAANSAAAAADREAGGGGYDGVDVCVICIRAEDDIGQSPELIDALAAVVAQQAGAIQIMSLSSLRTSCTLRTLRTLRILYAPWVRTFVR